MAMLLKRFYDPKLAQASYLVGCTISGEALVVDPKRDVTPYLEAAELDGLRVPHGTKPQFHAVFFSGALELVNKKKARLYLSAAGGHDWQYDYAASVGA